MLDAAGQQVQSAVPLAHLGFAVVERPGLGGVSAERLVERNVEEAGERAAGVVANQGGEHRAVVVGVEDAFDDRVVAAGEGETGGLVDEADVRAPGNVVLAQDDPSQVVLANDRQAAPVLVAYRRRGRGLAGRGVAPDHDQPRRVRGILVGAPDARPGGRVSLMPGRRGVALPRPAELGAGLRGGEGEQFRGQDPGVLGDARCRGDVVRGEPADLVFRFPDGATAGGGCDVDVVFVNVRLAGVPVRGGAPFGTRGLYVQVVRALGDRPRYLKAELMAQAADLLAAGAAERHRTVVLIVDEAHLLRPDQLEELRLMTNAEMDSASPFAGILVGQPTLARQLRMGTFAALDQRIATRYAIKPMDLAESAAYLRHHLALAGREEPLFADDAVARLHRVSSGLPRALNNAAVAALIAAAAAAGQDLVDDACAKKAVAELTRD